MGRGLAAPEVLPLTEAHVVPLENLLWLPFREGSALEIRWTTTDSRITVSGTALPAHRLVPVRFDLKLLATWLREVKAILDRPTGSFAFGIYEFAWSDASCPSLYVYPQADQDVIYLGTLASRDVLRNFLKLAGDEGLFQAAL